MVPSTTRVQDKKRLLRRLIEQVMVWVPKQATEIRAHA